jgi:hypothetical protein
LVAHSRYVSCHCVSFVCRMSCSFRS